MCGELCGFYPHGSALWTIKFCPYVAEDGEVHVSQQGAEVTSVITGHGDTKVEEDKRQLKYSTFLIGFRCNHGFLDGVGTLSLMQDMGKMIRFADASLSFFTAFASCMLINKFIKAAFNINSLSMFWVAQ